MFLFHLVPSASKVAESHVNEALANMGPHWGSRTSELGDQGKSFFSKFLLEDGDTPPSALKNFCK